MKKFNLKKALLGEKVTTRSGRSVILTGAVLGDYVGAEFILRGVVDNDGRMSIEAWTLDGKFMSAGDSDLDLFMV